MSRKVNIEVEGIVMIPVKFKAELLIRADDDANVGGIVKQFFRGKTHSKGDVEDHSVEILDIDGQGDLDDELIADLVSQRVESGVGPFKLTKQEVTDSR